MSDTKWLQNYYGDAFSALGPTVEMDGTFAAVVRLRVANAMSAGLSRTGYVLIRKNGKHNITPHKSLHEGVPTQKDMDRMAKVLAEDDHE